MRKFYSPSPAPETLFRCGINSARKTKFSSEARKFYITTSIAYTNAPPHIGFSQELIQADVIARHHQLLDENVFFLTGTDEHGEKIVRAAKEDNKEPREFAEKISTKFKELTKALGLSNNDFIRTTDQKRHWPAVKKVWFKLKKNGDIYKKKYRGLYCVGCESFIKEKDLVNGKCPIHEKAPEIIEEENYFFKLSRYQKQIKKIIEKDEIKIIPQARKNETLSFINQGLEDISCSRLRKNLKWGIPVPGDRSQTIYIWFEALVNYISALGYGRGEAKFRQFWPADVHCIGKDIFKFHCLLWPAMLLSIKISLPKTILIHGFITADGQKMSKSLGNVVDPFELIKRYGQDAVRYFLLREISSTEDGDFTYEKFEQRYNADLASGLGNLVARVIKMAERFKAQNLNLKSTSQNPKLKKEIDNTWRKYKKTLDKFKFNESLISIWELISFCDKYIEKERPWSFYSAQDKENSKRVISDLLTALNNIAKMLQPFLPETSKKILGQTKRIKKEKPLFPKLR